MPSRKWIHQQWHLLLFGPMLLVVLAVNGISWMQAYTMTHFVESGLPTVPPERLSFGAKAWVVLTGVRHPRPENYVTPKDISLSYETHHIAVSNTAALEAWFIPTAHPHGVVVFFPAYGASKGSLLGKAAIMHQLDYDVLLVDFRGAGGSSGNDTTIGVREADDVKLAVTYVQQKWHGQKILLYGMSMGAAAITRAIALQGVKPEAVILESPFDSLLNAVRDRFQAMGLPAFPTAELLVFWGGVQHGFNGFAHNPSDYTKAIECPTLLLYGQQDRRVKKSEVDAIFKNLRGPKQLVSFAGAGHESLVAADANRWKQHMAQFLRLVN